MSIRLGCVVLVGASLLGLTACGSKTPPVEPAGAIHLDLRLEQGEPSHARMDPESKLVREWVFNEATKEAEQLAAWDVINAIYRDDPKSKGLGLYIKEYDPARFLTAITLGYNEVVDTSEIDAIEIRANFQGPGLASVSWCDAKTNANFTLERSTQSGRGVTYLPLAGHTGWRGEITNLRLRPVMRGPQNFVLESICFRSGGLQWGAEPSAEGGDVGLLGFQGDLRRTWASDLDAPLFAVVDPVPKDAYLALDCGLVRSPRDAGSVTLRVDGRVENEAWRPLIQVEQDSLSESWQALQADLSDYAGRAIQLRFTASTHGASIDSIEGRDPRFVAVWWGAPRIGSQAANLDLPNILLVTLDTLRRDYVGVYGGHVPTPNLDALSNRSLVFQDAWSGANSTLPSHTSIMTGLAVPSHGVISNRRKLATGVRTLAEDLYERGYQTAAAVSINHLQADYSGLGRGFERFLDVQPGASKDGMKTLEALDDWMGDWAKEKTGPVFLWVHLFDPHTPYTPPNQFIAKYRKQREAAGVVTPKPRGGDVVIPDIRIRNSGEFLESIDNPGFANFLYGCGVAYTDQLMGRLVDSVERSLPRDTIWAVTSDHGESLGEHGVWYDHAGIYPSTVRVPLILHVPGGPTGMVGTRVSNVELRRTLLDLVAGDSSGVSPAGLASPDLVGGNLLELQRLESAGQAVERRLHFVGTDTRQLGMAEGQDYLILDQADYQSSFLPVFFRRDQDPGCEVDLAPEEAELVLRYQKSTMAWLESRSTGLEVRAKISAEDEARLIGLGYTGDDGDSE